MSYTIQYTPDAQDQLRNLTARQRSIAKSAIENNLQHEPLKETRNRKPLRPNTLAAWELRAGEIRVFYDADEETETVAIEAVGIKRGNRIYIGGEEVEL